MQASAGLLLTWCYSWSLCGITTGWLDGHCSEWLCLWSLTCNPKYSVVLL